MRLMSRTIRTGPRLGQNKSSNVQGCPSETRGDSELSETLCDVLPSPRMAASQFRSSHATWHSRMRQESERCRCKAAVMESGRDNFQLHTQSTRFRKTLRSLTSCSLSRSHSNTIPNRASHNAVAMPRRSQLHTTIIRRYENNLKALQDKSNHNPEETTTILILSKHVKNIILTCIPTRSNNSLHASYQCQDKI